MTSPRSARVCSRDLFWLFMSIPICASLLWIGAVLLGAVKVRSVPAATVEERVA